MEGNLWWMCQRSGQVVGNLTINVRRRAASRQCKMREMRTINEWSRVAWTPDGRPTALPFLSPHQFHPHPEADCTISAFINPSSTASNLFITSTSRSSVRASTNVHRTCIMIRPAIEERPDDPASTNSSFCNSEEHGLLKLDRLQQYTMRKSSTNNHTTTSCWHNARPLRPTKAACFCRHGRAFVSTTASLVSLWTAISIWNTAMGARSYGWHREHQIVQTKSQTKPFWIHADSASKPSTSFPIPGILVSVATQEPLIEILVIRIHVYVLATMTLHRSRQQDRYQNGVMACCILVATFSALHGCPGQPWREILAFILASISVSMALGLSSSALGHASFELRKSRQGVSLQCTERMDKHQEV